MPAGHYVIDGRHVPALRRYATISDNIPASLRKEENEWDKVKDCGYGQKPEEPLPAKELGQDATKNWCNSGRNHGTELGHASRSVSSGGS